MTDLPGEWGPSKQSWVDMKSNEISPYLSPEEQICRWALRLLLPLILALCGQLVFWMWFDNVYGPDVWSVVGGSVLAVVSVPVALWTWHSWLPDEVEITAGRGPGMRNVFLGLVAFAAIAGWTRPNDGDHVRDGSLQIARMAQEQVVTGNAAARTLPATDE
jgi:hypothetical protein